MTSYEPGTVAVATVRGVPNVRVFRSGSGWQTPEAWVSETGVTDVRPLVVLDLGNDIPSFLIDLRDGLGGERANAIADQIEAQTKPPRIPEPTEPLAEVEASTHGRERRRLVRGLTRGGGGHDVRWVDGVSSWSWHELIDPVLVREGVES